MRILLDSNIFISALLVEGNERHLIEKALSSRHTLVLTDLIAEEIERFLSRKLSKNKSVKARALWVTLQTSPSVYRKEKHQYKKLLFKAQRFINLQDSPILATGFQEEINAVVTGDKDFLENKKLQHLRRKKIFTSREIIPSL